MRAQFKRVRGVNYYPNGYYGIDPDKALVEEPFEVYCEFPYKTVVKVTSRYTLLLSICVHVCINLQVGFAVK